MVLPVEPEYEQVASFISCNNPSMFTRFQALNELKQSLSYFLAQNPTYEKALDVVQIPERVVQFRVVWEDDKGQAQVNRGFRVQVGQHPLHLLYMFREPLPFHFPV